ncbi:MAG: hypothetical protein GXO47_05150 [Chlorobi bacterium]|nr:hypothetical protein [Chlorobiota bacterium]
MKNLTLLSFLGILLFSCTPRETEPVAKIHGKILSGDVKDVKIEWVMDNPLTLMSDSYIAKVDSTGSFSVSIPVVRLAYASIKTGNISHRIYFKPYDDLFIEINSDSISYEGKGAAKNNFVIEMEKKGLSVHDFYSEYNQQGKLKPNVFADKMKEFMQKRFELIDSFQKLQPLEKEFIDFFKINTEVIYENFIRNYIRRYSYFNTIPFDSIDLLYDYNNLNSLARCTDDKKVISSTYLRSISRLVNEKAKELMLSGDIKGRKRARNIVLKDSLKGKTREYLIAKTITTELMFNSPDTALNKIFFEVSSDSIPIKAVNRALEKYNEKQALIGKPINKEFAQTILLDTANNEITFGQMMKQNRGNVIYLDIWNLGCGPCRAAMPYSKILREKLNGLPVKFIYITTDDINRKGVLDNIFKITKSRENHYFFKNGFEAKFLKFMNISFVPCYMIFDKEGNLMDFNADRPTRMVETTETPLEKTLKELALKQELKRDL